MFLYKKIIARMLCHFFFLAISLDDFTSTFLECTVTENHCMARKVCFGTKYMNILFWLVVAVT